MSVHLGMSAGSSFLAVKVNILRLFFSLPLSAKRRQGRERVNLAPAAAAFHAVIGFKGTATAAVGRERGAGSWGGGAGNARGGVPYPIGRKYLRLIPWMFLLKDT